MEFYKFVKLSEGRKWDLLLLFRVVAECCENAYGLGPCVYRVAEAMHGGGEGVLPHEFFVVCVYHREISVKAIYRVSDESASFRADYFVAYCVEYTSN